jgi:hypothetical protein
MGYIVGIGMDGIHDALDNKDHESCDTPPGSRLPGLIQEERECGGDTCKAIQHLEGKRGGRTIHPQQCAGFVLQEKKREVQVYKQGEQGKGDWYWQ